MVHWGLGSDFQGGVNSGDLAHKSWGLRGRCRATARPDQLGQIIRIDSWLFLGEKSMVQALLNARLPGQLSVHFCERGILPSHKQ